MNKAQQAKLNRLTQGLKKSGVSVDSVDVLMDCFGLPKGWASVVLKTSVGDRVYGISPEGDAHS